MRRAQRVLLVGFQDQDNLGLRYLASSASAAGHETEIVTYQSDPSTILDRIGTYRPDVVGFSLIFQYMAPDFARVVEALREAGVTALFVMGGHYPSFEYAEILKRMPGLDAVIRFEGERTLVDLLDCLAEEREWRGIAGIAIRNAGGAVQANPLRPPIDDLDALPWPDRATIDYESHSNPTASLLASRGCPWNCSFCSIRPFYEEQGGALRRLRKPSAVVDEMMDLRRRRGVPVFLFQDDDFLATGRRARTWAKLIADLIISKGLAGEVAFKISCRSDEVRPEIMRDLVRGGLTHVYLGVESGDIQGLQNMNKMLDPEAHFEAGRVLREHGLSFDFGFMLLEPYSTIDIVASNIDFLERFVGDGWSVAPFCRMLPYAGTRVKEKLEAEGRLLGTSFEPDYKFLDPKLDLFYEWMLRTFYERNFTAQGLCHVLRALNFEARLKLPQHNPITDTQRAYLQYLTSVCNRVACYTLRSALEHVDETPLKTLQNMPEVLESLTAHEMKEEARLSSEVARYYDWTHKDGNAVPGPVPSSFNKSWTFNEGDREAAGVGAT